MQAMFLMQRELGWALDRQRGQGQSGESRRIPEKWKLSGELRQRLCL